MNKNDTNKYTEEIKGKLRGCSMEYFNAAYERNVKEINLRAAEIEKQIRRAAKVKNS